MDGWMDGWVDGGWMMAGWMGDGWWVSEQMDGWVGAQKEGQVDGTTDGRIMCGGIEGWRNEWVTGGWADGPIAGRRWQGNSAPQAVHPGACESLAWQRDSEDVLSEESCAGEIVLGHPVAQCSHQGPGV